MKIKKNVDISKTCEDKIERVKALQKKGLKSGIANKPLFEPVPSIDISEGESVIEGKNNAFIILGRDRPSHLLSGEGGKGATQAGRIDLIAGIGASYLHEDGSRMPPCENSRLSPNFAIDGARVYISQKSHLDKYMGLADVEGDSPAGRSGIGLKADSIQIHSRGDIKIVTGKGKFSGVGSDGEPFSTGGVNDVTGKISLIAGNYTGKRNRMGFSLFSPTGRIRRDTNVLQPLVKGDNLIELFYDLTDAIEKLSRAVGDNQNQIASITSRLMFHTHIGATGPVSPSPEAIILKTESMIKQLLEKSDRKLINKDLNMIKGNYLSTSGGGYIASRHVFTT